MYTVNTKPQAKRLFTIPDGKLFKLTVEYLGRPNDKLDHAVCEAFMKPYAGCEYDPMTDRRTITCNYSNAAWGNAALKTLQEFGKRTMLSVTIWEL